VVAGEVEQVFGFHVTAELFREAFRVLNTGPEGDDAADVSEHGIGGFLRQL
jgi:hypothetical protein